MRRFVLIVAVALAAGACNAAPDDVVASPGPTSTPGGTTDAVESRENKLPDGFPDDFPLPVGRRVVFSQSNDQGSLVYFDATQSRSDLVTFFEGELAGEGWVIRECTETEASPGPATLLIAQKGNVLATTVIGRLPNPNVDLREDEYDFFVTVLRTTAELADDGSARCS